MWTYQTNITGPRLEAGFLKVFFSVGFLVDTCCTNYFSPFSATQPRMKSFSKKELEKLLFPLILLTTILYPAAFRLKERETDRQTHCVLVVIYDVPSFTASSGAVGRGNTEWTTSKSGHPWPCQNCKQGPPAEKAGRGSLLNRPSCPTPFPTTHSAKGLNWTDDGICSCACE